MVKREDCYELGGEQKSLGFVWAVHVLSHFSVQCEVNIGILLKQTFQQLVNTLKMPIDRPSKVFLALCKGSINSVVIIHYYCLSVWETR